MEGSHRALVVVVAIAALVCAIIGLPVACLMLTVVALAASRSLGWRATVERLPWSGVIVVAAIASVTLAAGVAGVDVMSSRWSGRLLLVGLVLALVSLSLSTAPTHRTTATRSWRDLGMAAAPAGLMALIGLFLAASPLGARTSWFLSGDHVRHLALVTRTIDAGALEYDSQTYPRAWHAALALLWSTTGSGRDTDGLAELIRLQSLLTWGLLVLVPLALALTATALHRARGGGPLIGGAAGCLTGALILGPWFFGDYVPRGFQTSLLALLVLAVAVQRVTESRADRGALFVVATSGAVLAHVWQVLIPVVGALLLVVLVRRWRPRPPTRTLLLDAGILASSTAVALPGLLAAARGYGLDAASVAGDVPAPVVEWLVVVLVSGVLLAITGRRSVLAACVASVGAGLATALGLAVVTGVGVDSYYPSKTLWTAVALGLPLVGAAAAHLAQGGLRTSRLGPPVPIALGTMVGGLVLLCAVTPVMGVAGSWSAADGKAVLATVTATPAPTAQVVWSVGTETDDATSQLLLDFYTATATSPPLGLAARDVVDQCALLADAPSPVVLSRQPLEVVRERFRCVPETAAVTP